MAPARAFKSLCSATACILLALTLSACGGGGEGSIGGTVSGLTTGNSLTLQNNGSDTLTVTASGTFTFATTESSSSPYSVTVLTQPTGQVCSVEDGAGTVDQSGDAIKSVSVTCVAMSNVGGTVSGLLAGTAVTLSNGSVLLPVAVNGDFAFPGLVASGATYDITIATQPVGETCTILNGIGTVSGNTAVTLTVTCS